MVMGVCLESALFVFCRAVLPRSRSIPHKDTGLAIARVLMGRMGNWGLGYPLHMLFVHLESEKSSSSAPKRQERKRPHKRSQCMPCMHACDPRAGALLPVHLCVVLLIFERFVEANLCSIEVWFVRG